MQHSRLRLDGYERAATQSKGLAGFRLRRSDIEKPGGRKSQIADAIDKAFTRFGWVEKGFHTKIVVDTIELESPTHKVDCYKNHVALEVEWNN